MTKALVLLKGDSKKLKARLGADLAKRVESATPNKGMINPNFAHPDWDYITVADREITDEKSAREFGGDMYTRFKDKVTELEIDVDSKFVNDIQEGVAMAGYVFQRYKTKPKDPKIWFEKVNVVGAESYGIYDSIELARDLVSEPGNVLFPAEYARRATVALTDVGVTVKVYHEAQLQDMGFNLLLSVGQGSTKDSYVVVMEYMNGKDEQPLALVGKGVCFDTGGISLKPSKGMGDMKYDMGGSAAVVGAMHAIASANVKRNVVGIIGLVENMPDGNAIKPGDVVKSLSGKTVENLNTDAEGRLVLADILHYVQDEYNPDTIIDLATLTGAILVSLGHEMAGLFTNSTELEKIIVGAGKKAGEGFYRMPMGENWNKMIDSDIADMQNIGGPYGGSTTAAEFLYRFVDSERAFAHLDIAGMAWADKPNSVTPKGAMGFGVRTLYNIAKTKGVQGLAIDEDMKY